MGLFGGGHHSTVVEEPAPKQVQQYTPLATPGPQQQVSQAGDSSAQQAQAQANLNNGYAGSLLTGGTGVNESGDTSGKTLLGQ